MVFQKLGLAVTFSPNAVSLLKTAKRLQNLFGSELLLIHAGGKSIETEKLMQDILRQTDIEENSYELIWQEGDPSKVIINACKARNVDLLISGALEKESILKYYIGSVARNIMRESPCSILILTHTSTGEKPFKKFCASVQYNSLGEYAIRKAYEFAKLEKADEFVLIKEFEIPGLAITISDTGSMQETERKRAYWQREEELKLDVFAKELNLSGVELKTVCLYGKQGWVSSNYAREYNGDLLIVPLPHQKLKLFDRIFQHDIEFVFKQLPCALLIIREGHN